MTMHDLATQYITAFNMRDGAALSALLHEDIAHDDAWGNRVIGANAVRTKLAEAAANLDWSLHDHVIMADKSAQNFAIHTTLRGRYLHNMNGLPEAKGQNFDISAIIFLIVEDGQITQITEFLATNGLNAALA